MSKERFFLWYKEHDYESETVYFYTVDEEGVAARLCELLTQQYVSPDDPIFTEYGASSEHKMKWAELVLIEDEIADIRRAATLSPISAANRPQARTQRTWRIELASFCLKWEGLARQKEERDRRVLQDIFGEQLPDAVPLTEILGHNAAEVANAPADTVKVENNRPWQCPTIATEQAAVSPDYYLLWKSADWAMPGDFYFWKTADLATAQELRDAMTSQFPHAGQHYKHFAIQPADKMAEIARRSADQQIARLIQIATGTEDAGSPTWTPPGDVDKQLAEFAARCKELTADTDPPIAAASTPDASLAAQSWRDIADAATRFRRAMSDIIDGYADIDEADERLKSPSLADWERHALCERIETYDNRVRIAHEAMFESYPNALAGAELLQVDPLPIARIAEVGPNHPEAAEGAMAACRVISARALAKAEAMRLSESAAGPTVQRHYQATIDVEVEEDAKVAAATVGTSEPTGGETPSPGEPAAVGASGMTWQEARKVAEDHCARNPFPGPNALRRIVRDKMGRTCAQGTILKAIDRSDKLRDMKVTYDAHRKGGSAVAMTDGILASAKQTREPNPIDAAAESTDALFQRLVEQAKPEERAKLHAMTEEQRRELVATAGHDPDYHALDETPRVRGRSR